MNPVLPASTATGASGGGEMIGSAPPKDRVVGETAATGGVESAADDPRQEQFAAPKVMAMVDKVIRDNTTAPVTTAQ